MITGKEYVISLLKNDQKILSDNYADLVKSVRMSVQSNEIQEAIKIIVGRLDGLKNAIEILEII